jgi:WD40 repeat protein
MFDFSGYITERIRDFTGREWLFATIDHWLTDRDAPQIFLLTGEPGIGKTAIAARLTQFSAGDAIPPTDYGCVGDGFLSAVHFCSARNGGWISPDGFARSLSAQLAARYPAFADALASDPRIHIEQKAGVVSGTMIGVQITNYYAETSEGLFNDLVRTPLQALCRKIGLAGPLTILVDGLDESLNYSGRTNIVRLLAACWDLPPQVRLLLTSRPVDGVLGPFRLLQPFILYARSEENRGDVRAYVSYRFEASAALRDQAGDEAQVEQVRDSLVARSRGNFLVVSKVLDGAARGELSLEDPEALPAELQDLYAWFLDRLIQGDMRVWRSLYRPVLGVLAVAQEPVDASTLCRWTGLTYQQVTDVLHDLREFLDPALDGQCRLYHDSVVEFLTGNRAGSYTLDAVDHHRQIAASYTHRFIENEGKWPDCDLYGLRYLPAHMFEAGETEALRRLLFDFVWLQAKLEATDVNHLIADYVFLPNDAHLRLIQSAIRLTAHFLAQDKAQLWTQLYGRMIVHRGPDIQRMLAEWPSTPWLRTLTPSLTQAGEPLLRTLIGHTDEVWGVAVTPDGGQAVSASADHTLRVWNLARGETLRKLVGHSGRVRAIAVAPDGRRAVSASDDGTLKVWDLWTGEVLRTLMGHRDWVATVAMTPDGKRAVSAAEHIKMWDLESGKEIRAFEDYTAEVWAVTVTPNGKYIVSASADRTVRVWDVESGEELRSLRGHRDDVSAVAVTPDGRRAVSASDDGTLKVWDLWNGEEIHTLKGYTFEVRAVAVTPDGQRAVSGAWDGTLKVWDLVRGEELCTLDGHTGEVRTVAVMPDGRHSISGASDNTLKIWDLESREELHVRKRHTSSADRIAVTSDSRLAISASSDIAASSDCTLKVWDIDTGEELFILEGHSQTVSTIAVTPDNEYAISASWDKTLKVWDMKTGNELHTLRGHSGYIHRVAVTPDGQHIVSASLDRTLKVWELESGEELRNFRGHTNWVRAVAVTPDGRNVISASADGILKVWELESGEELHTLKGHSDTVWEIAITPDGRHAISASKDHTLKVWDLNIGEELFTLKGHTDSVYSVVVMPNAKHAISLSHDRTLKIWDLRNGEELHTIGGYGVFFRAVTPDGKCAISVINNTLKVLDIERGTAVATFIGDAPMGSCAVKADGVTVVVGDALGRVHFLRLEGVDQSQRDE